MLLMMVLWSGVTFVATVFRNCRIGVVEVK